MNKVSQNKTSPQVDAQGNTIYWLPQTVEFNGKSFNAEFPYTVNENGKRKFRPYSFNDEGYPNRVTVSLPKEAYKAIYDELYNDTELLEELHFWGGSNFLLLDEKVPLGKDWTKKRESIYDVLEKIKKGLGNGIGWLPNYKVVHVDVDSQEAWDYLLNEITTDPEEQKAIYNTWHWTSGADGRTKFPLRFSKQQKQTLEDLEEQGFDTNKINASSNGEKNDLELLIGDGVQTVVYGLHAKQGRYNFTQRPDEYELYKCPDQLFDFIVEGIKNNKNKNKTSTGKNNKTSGEYTQDKYDIALNDIIQKYGCHELYITIISHLKPDYTDHFTDHSQGWIAGGCPHCGVGDTLSRFQINVEGNYGWYCHHCLEGGYIFNLIHLLKTGSTSLDINAKRQYLELICNLTGYQDKSPSQDDSFYYKLNDFQPQTTDYLICKWLEAKDYIVINDEFYQYTGLGYWKYIPPNVIQKRILHHLREVYWEKKDTDKEGNETFYRDYRYFTDTKKNSAYKSALSYLDYKENLPENNHLICFNNGTLNIKTKELEGHKRDNFIFSCIPLDFELENNNPQQFLEFLETAIGEKQIPYIQAFIQTLLDPTAPYGVFLHLIGDSRSGKGTLLRTMAKLFNQENVSSLNSFSDLNDKDARHQNLRNKRFCYFPDMAGYTQGLNAFYELVDNGFLSGRSLYSSRAYTQQWHCRFALASVNQLKIENSGAGWDGRRIPIQFNKRQGKKDVDLESKIEQELHQIIAWALTISREQTKELLHGELGDVQKELQQEQEVMSDSISAFINAMLKPRLDGFSDSQHDATLYDYYVAYCQSAGITGLSFHNFRTKIRQQLSGFVTRNPRKGIPRHVGQISINTNAYVDGRILLNECWDDGLEAFENPQEFCRKQEETPPTNDDKGEQPEPFYEDDQSSVDGESKVYTYTYLFNKFKTDYGNLPVLNQYLEAIKDGQVAGKKRDLEGLKEDLEKRISELEKERSDN